MDMKRIVYSFIFIISMFILVGCGEEMTPKQAVMDYMESYVTLDDSVVTQLNEYVENDSELNDEQKKKLKDGTLFKNFCPVCGRKAYLKCEHDYKKAYYRHIKKKKSENI